MKEKKSSVENALLKKASAERKRNEADYFSSSDPMRARLGRSEADKLDGKADEVLNLCFPPEIGTGGELVPSHERAIESQGIIDTVREPNGVTVEASFERLNIANEANCLNLAADMAETIGAANSAEKALAHQLAGLHATSMRMLAKVESEMKKIGLYHGNHAQVETARLANATTRLMKTYQEGLQTLQKLRTGGKQTVVVQHVQVKEGGRAFVAGNVQGGRGNGRK